jgi:hypothetical protein
MKTVPDAPGMWRKSSRSAQETDCIELAYAGAVRDSKNPDGPRLELSFAGLVALAKALDA